MCRKYIFFLKFPGFSFGRIKSINLHEEKFAWDFVSAGAATGEMVNFHMKN